MWQDSQKRFLSLPSFVFMDYTTSHSPILYVIGFPLECVRSYRYLGILTSSDLLWANHIKDVTSKVRKQIGLLYRHFYKRALPHLECGVPAWDPHLCKEIDMLESVQSFAKLCTKLWNNLHYQDCLETSSGHSTQAKGLPEAGSSL